MPTFIQDVTDNEVLGVEYTCTGATNFAEVMGAISGWVCGLHGEVGLMYNLSEKMQSVPYNDYKEGLIDEFLRSASFGRELPSWQYNYWRSQNCLPCYVEAPLTENLSRLCKVWCGTVFWDGGNPVMTAFIPLK